MRALILAAVAMAGCATYTREVTPWFRVEHHEPFMDQPVRIGDRAHDIAFARRDGKWVQIASGFVHAIPARDKRLVVFSEGFTWFAARESGEITELPRECSFPALHPTRPVIYCARCATMDPPRTGNCTGAVVSQLDASGNVTSELRSEGPELKKSWSVWPVALLPDDTVILTTHEACRLLAVGPGGVRVLADAPKKRECSRFRNWTDVLVPLDAVPLVTFTDW